MVGDYKVRSFSRLDWREPKNNGAEAFTRQLQWFQWNWHPYSILEYPYDHGKLTVYNDIPV